MQKFNNFEIYYPQEPQIVPTPLQATNKIIITHGLIKGLCKNHLNICFDSIKITSNLAWLVALFVVN